MWWSLCSVALAGDLILALKVTGPDGRVTLQDEVSVPAEKMVPSPDQKHTLGIYGAVFDADGAVIELVAGKTKDGKPVPKVTKSFELDAWTPKTETLIYKKSTWTIEAKLGEVWESPEPKPAEDTARYVLAWDDAQLVKDPAKLEDPKVMKDPKKLAAATAAEVTRERELPGGRVDAMAEASPVKFIEMYKETHVNAETTAPGASHCVTGGAPAEGAAPTAFIPLTDLVRHVTAREVVGKLPDGTGWRVAGGVPVVAEGEGTWRVNTGGLSFLIQATEDDLAFYYRPSPHFETGEVPARIPAGTIGKTAVGDVTWAGPGPIPVAAMRGVVTPIAVVRVPCAEVKVMADPTAFER